MRNRSKLTPVEMRAARAEAKRLGISLAELVRRPLPPAEAARPWMRFAGMVESGDAGASERIDDVIHGQRD